MSSYLYCATERGVAQHLADGESCRVCKDWMKLVGAKIVNGKVIAPKPKPIPEPKPKPKKRVRPKREPRTVELAPCGTIGAYNRHRRAGEPICDPCREAQRLNQKQRRERIKAERANTPLTPAVTRDRCGTRAGANYHRDHGEEKCEPCLEAARAYHRETYHRNKKPAKRNGRPPTPREHGTKKGYDQHRRNNDPICEPCRLANNTHQREYQERKAREATRS